MILPEFRKPDKIVFIDNNSRICNWSDLGFELDSNSKHTVEEDWNFLNAIDYGRMPSGLRPSSATIDDDYIEVVFYGLARRFEWTKSEVRLEFTIKSHDETDGVRISRKTEHAILGKAEDVRKKAAELGFHY